MGTNCAPLVADLFLFCYERDFMKYLSSDNQADVIKAFNSTSRYLDDLLTLTILILKEWSTKFIHLNCNLIKLKLQILRPPFWIYIWLFLTAFRLAICSHCIWLFVIFIYFPLWFLERDLPFDCSSSCSLLFYYL